MMGLMHKGDPYGHLKLNGGPVDVKQLSVLVRADLRTTKRALEELQRQGVCSTTPSGVIYSRRMTRDEVERAGSRKRVKKHRMGESEGAVVTEKKRQCNGAVTQKKHPSSSSSSSSSTSTSKKEEKREPASPPPAWHAGVTWDKKKNKTEVSEGAWREISGQLQELAKAEDLPVLSRPEYALSMNRLNGHLIGNPHKRGKTLPAIMRNWFETDMRTKAERIDGARPQSEAAAHVAWELEQEAEQTAERLRSIAACEEPHTPDQLTQRERYAFCGCGYREDKP